MKQRLTPLAMLILLSTLIIWLKGCGGQTTPANDVVESEHTVLQEKFTDPISIRATGQLMEALFAHSELRDLAIKHGMYGAFNNQVFDLAECGSLECGVLLWYCYNPQEKLNLPRFFVAVEQLAKFDSTGEYSRPVNDSLYVPFTTFQYSGGDQAGDAARWLRTHRTSVAGRIPQISRADVVEFVEEFKKFNKTVTHQGTSFVHFPYAFFRNNQAYRTFMARRPAYVRYYFGVHWTDSLRPNYLRPILGGANSQGQAVERSVDPEDNPFLQKSIPPPPTQD